ncbi:hypothetical protein GCM10011359_18900 [Nesterenkonia alkaliphila]|nr:hypothetical protein GCM10011359_18900 [Nesterenkonia alkaliphila]
MGFEGAIGVGHFDIGGTAYGLHDLADRIVDLILADRCGHQALPIDGCNRHTSGIDIEADTVPAGFIERTHTSQVRWAPSSAQLSGPGLPRRPQDSLACLRVF